MKVNECASVIGMCCINKAILGGFAVFSPLFWTWNVEISAQNILQSQHLQADLTLCVSHTYSSHSPPKKHPVVSRLMFPWFAEMYNANILVWWSACMEKSVQSRLSFLQCCIWLFYCFIIVLTSCCNAMSLPFSAKSKILNHNETSLIQ